MSRSRSRRRTLVWAGATLLPFVVLACRIALSRRHLFFSGDLAVLDLDVHRALRWHQLLGVYGRFGWRHPGPVYTYLIAFIARLVGPSHGQQAQQITATAVDGLALAGTVFVIGRLAGSRAAAAATVVCLGVVAGLGVLSDPWIAWNPSVVILPLVLLCVLAVAAAGGSVTALAACVLVGTFSIQSHLGTLPLVGVLVVGSLAVMLTRARHARQRRAWLTPGVLTLLTAAAACWIPPVYQQLTGSPGNVSTTVRFFLHAGKHAGGSGAATAGAAIVRAVGVHPFPPLRPGLAGFLGSMVLPDRAVGFVELALSASAALALLVVARRRRDPLAMRHAVVFAAGVLVAGIAGASIVGPPFAWLVWWTAAPAAAGLVAAALLVLGSKRLGDGAAARVPGLVALLVVGGLTTWALLLPRIGPPSNPAIATTWKALDPLVTDTPHQAVGLWMSDGRTPGYVAWLVDELDARHIPFVIPKQWHFMLGPGHDGPEPQRWVLVDGPEQVLPTGYRSLGIVDGLRYSYGTTRPPGGPA